MYGSVFTVIYDDHLTDAFFMCLVQLYYDVVKENCVVYIALEKRLATCFVGIIFLPYQILYVTV